MCRISAPEAEGAVGHLSMAMFILGEAAGFARYTDLLEAPSGSAFWSEDWIAQRESLPARLENARRVYLDIVEPRLRNFDAWFAAADIQQFSHEPLDDRGRDRRSQFLDFIGAVVPSEALNEQLGEFEGAYRVNALDPRVFGPNVHGLSAEAQAAAKLNSEPVDTLLGALFFDGWDKLTPKHVRDPAGLILELGQLSDDEARELGPWFWRNIPLYLAAAAQSCE